MRTGEMPYPTAASMNGDLSTSATALRTCESRNGREPAANTMAGRASALPVLHLESRIPSVSHIGVQPSHREISRSNSEKQETQSKHHFGNGQQQAR